MDRVEDSPIGVCRECMKACPASAIKNVSTDSYYASRESAIALEKCFAKTCEFKDMPGIGATICGVCIKVCPFGRKGRRGMTKSKM